MSPLFRKLGAVASFLCCTSVSSATWSVVVVDTQTGEVCISSATCIVNFNLQKNLAVVVPGIGAAACQSAIDASGANRLLIWNQLQAGTSPEQILAQLALSDANHKGRQYGIVSLAHAPVTFTGQFVGEGKEGVIGQVGSLRYAIQGNVLTGDPVVYAAETALLATSGSLADRVMAAMEAARVKGGDGRCSCSQVAPTSCGSPPPSFSKSAHCGFLVVARQGDTLGTCSQATGCANGGYHISLNIAGADSLLHDPDPILQLAQKYAQWKLDHVGHPDHLASTVTASAQSLVADGKSKLDVTVRLIDLNGSALTSGGATLSVAQQSGPAALASIGPVVDLGDGSYTFALTAANVAGSGNFTIRVNDGTYDIQLYPPLELRVDPLVPLHCGYDTVEVGAAVDVPLTINVDPALAGEPYLVLASASGSTPGMTVHGGVHLPLNPDPLLLYSLLAGPLPFFPGGIGVLDGAGRAGAELLLAPGALTSLAGGRIDFAAVVRTLPLVPTNAAGFDVLP
ncbi:MAG: DUF1028 domain-containing protein [Planctomycetes bacterium]|nr:DUF1028 domain-containing protein [Planctomycetota bacterium]